MRNLNSLLNRLIIVACIVTFQISVGYGQCSVNAGNDTTICQGQRFVRTATFTGSSSTIRWYNKSNPSSDLSTNATINIVRNVPGKDTIIIRVNGTGSNCPDTDTVVVTVNPSPSINIGANQTLCQGEVKSITATFSPSNGVINWYLSGSTTSLGTGATFTIPTTAAGTLNYVAKVDSANTCSDFDTVQIVVNPKPNASFTYTPTGGCGRTRVNFTNTSNNGAIPVSTNGLTYNWDFGDGNNSTQANPSNTFNPGRGSGNATFTVRLIVTNSSSGCKDTSIVNINIGKTPDPTLNGPGSTIFNGQPYFKICASGASNFGFTNGSTTASTNTNYVIKWGDGTPDTSFNTFTTVVRHLYSIGSKKLTFIVYSGSCVDSTVYNVFVGNVPAGGIVGVGGSTICAGDAQNFVINGIANNPVGTVYIVDYKDGTKIDTFFHPAPDTITHIFPKSSCGSINSNGSTIFNESFGAYLSITNPCGSAGGSVLPIYVSDKPDPQISATRDSICELQDITFTNTGNPGNNVESGVCTPGKGVWEISSSTPGASWIAISGDPSLGNDFDDPDPNLWNPGATSINVRFNTKGIYTVRLVMANNTLCGRDTAIKTICVNPLPTASFTLNNNIGCAPLNVNALGSTNIPTCGTNRFQWSVSYTPTPDCTPATSGFSYEGGTNENSQNPQFKFTNPGVYTISLVTIAPGGACSAQAQPVQVTVKAKPIISINPIPASCQNSPINPSANVSCYTTNATYSWTFPGGNPSGSNQLTPGQVSYPTAGSYTINFDATNECGTTPASLPITINPLPTITGTSTVCVGRTITLSGSGSPATTSPWVSSNPAVASVDNSGVVTGRAQGTADITYTDINGCKRTVSITVNPNPAISVNSPSVCSPQSATLTVNGVADTYTWNPTNNLSASTGATVTANPSATTTYNVTGTFTATGCQTTVSSTVIIKPTPVISALGTAPTICGGNDGSITISGLTAFTTYQVRYTKNGVLVGPFTSQANSSGQINITGLTAGNYAQIEVSLNGCPSNQVGPFSFTDPDPPALTIPANDITVCATQPTGLIDFSVSPANGTISWNNNNTSIGLAASSTGDIPSFNAINNGTTQQIATISVFATRNGCTSATQTMRIIVNPRPDISVNSPAICSGQSTTLSVTGTADTYTWSPNTNLSATSGSQVTANPTTTTTYNITATFSATGCSRTIPSTVTVNPTPSINASGISPNICGGTNGSITITGLLINTNYLVRYTKNGILVGPLNLRSSAGGQIVIAGLSAGTYDQIEVVLNLCPSNKVGPIILSDPTQPILTIPSSDVIVCAGNPTGNINFSANPTSSAINWTNNNTTIGLVGSGSGSILSFNAINNTSVQQIAQLTVSATQNGCTSASQIMRIIVNPRPSITVNSPSICTGETATLTVNGAADTYSWSPNTNLSSTSGSQVIANPTTNTTYNVTATFSATGCQITIPSVVTVKPRPVITATASSPANCASSTGSIKISGLITGNIYTVNYLKNGVPQTITNRTAVAPGEINITNLTSGTYEDIEVVLNGCSSNKLGPFTLSDPNPPVLTIPTNDLVVCANDLTGNIIFSATPTGAIINWTNNNSSIGIPLTGTGSINSFTAQNNTTGQLIANISVTATLNGCTSASQSMKIIVNPEPQINNINIPICSEDGFSVTPSSSVAGNIIPANTTYRWTVADNPNVNGEQSQTTIDSSVITNGSLINTSDVAQPVVYTVTPKSGADGNCVGSAFTLTVTVNPRPKISDTTITVCGDATYNFTRRTWGSDIVPPGSQYSWSAPVFSNPGAITVLSGATAVDATTISGQLKNNTTQQQWAEFTITPKGVPGNCPGNTFKLRVIVNPRPVIQNITSTICSEETFDTIPSATLSGNVIPLNTTYTWTFTDNPFVNGEANQPSAQPNISGTLTNISNTEQLVLYTVTPRSGVLGNCPGEPFTVTIKVNPKPNIKDTVLTICSGTRFKYNPINTIPSMIVPSGTVYTWGAPVVTGGLIGGQAGTATDSIAGALTNPTSSVQTAVYTVTPKSGDCTGDDFTVTVRVNPAPGVIFNPGDQKICSGENTASVTLSSASSGVSIPWVATQPSGIAGVITSGTGVIPVQTLINNTPNPITVTYTATAQTTGSATCSGTPGIYNITVNPKPKIANITQEICSDSFFTVTPSPNVSGNIIPAGTTYSWPAPILSTPGSITGARPGNAQDLITDTLINLTNQVQTVRYTVVPKSGIADSCVGDPFTITVTVYPVPKIPTLYDTICTGETFLLNPINGSPNASVIVPNGTTYSWAAPATPPGVGGAQSGLRQSTITGVLTNTSFLPETIEYIVTPVSGIAGACQGDTFKVLVTVNPLSSIRNNPRSQTICTENTTAAVNWTSFTPNSSFAWTLVSSGTITGFAPSGQGPTLPAMTLTNAGEAVDSLVYSVTSTASACAAPATLYKIYVNPDAKARFNAPIDTACWPFNIPIENTSPATANGLYKWYANNVLFGTTTGGSNYPGYTIQNPDDNITIKMVAVSKYGCKPDSVSKSFYTYKQPDASFNSSINRACGPLSVYFTNTSTFNSTFKYAWDFGNGQTSNQYQPDSVFYVTNPNFGDTVYTITLKAFNQCDTLTFSKQIIVQSKPLARFLPNKTTGCSPLTVVYNNVSLGVGNTYIWDFGDGTPTVTTTIKDSIRHTYFVGIKDTFVVKLIALNQCGIDSSTFNLVVTPNPIKLDFAVLGTEQNGCAPHVVRFINKTSGADVFRWDFGDGNILSSVKNIDTITHTFINPGKYTVTLNASSICSDTSSTEIIDVFGKPAPKFTASTITRCIGDSIQFTNQTTGGATSYLWKFGDGNTSVLVNPGHKYAQSGTYTVTLIAFKDNLPGVVCIDSVKTQVRIIDTLPINFGISSTLGKCSPFKVTFTNTFLNYSFLEWDFGDGTKGTGDIVEHTYIDNGVYNIRLTIRSVGGCTYTAVKQITLTAPVGTLRVQTGFNCQDDNVRFEALPTNTDFIVWKFGDGDSLKTTERVVFHKYLNPGTYFASAQFVTNEGCRYDVPGTYEVKVDRIVPGFRAVRDESCSATKVRFVDTSNVFFGKSSVEWSFGNGSTATGFDVTHTYSTTGTYLVRQIVKSNSGCSDTIEIPVQVFVRSLPNAEIVSPPVICTNTDAQFSSVVTSTDPVNFYKWDFSNGINSDNNALTVRFANAGNVVAQLIAGTIYGCYDTVRSTLKISQTPTVRAAPDVTICKGQTVNLTATGALNYSWFPTDFLTNPNIPNPVSRPDVSTPYTVKGTTVDGCFAYDTININVIQPFKISVMPGDSICIGESIRLLASGAFRYEWAPASSLNQFNIPNPLATPVATTNYRVVGFDENGCFSDTGYVLIGVGLYPVVDLGPDLTLSTGTMQPLTTTITNGPIQQWLWSPPTNLSCITCPVPVAQIKTDIEYKVRVTTFFGCSGEDAIRIKVFCEETQVYIPNAFSPDGDGRNDVFMVRGKGIMQVKSMRVFNRWGDVVFEKTNITPNDPSDGWDGRVRGVSIGPDVFAYIVEVVCDNGVPYFYKGNVTLLK